MNIFGKLSKNTILFLALAELFSLVTYLLPPFDQAAFFVILALTVILVLTKLEYGLYLMLAELFVGGFGRLFSFPLGSFTISIRMALFFLILILWPIKRQKAKIKNQFKPNSDFLPACRQAGLLISYFLFLICLAFATINGAINNHLTTVFFDANAWVYFILIIIFWDSIKTKKTIADILQVLTGATAYLALKTLGVLFLFSQNITGIGGLFYKWLRDSGVGEITYVSGSIFRVFFQSQIYCLIGFLLVLMILLANYQKLKKSELILFLGYLYLTSLALLISQSRSYWVGAVAGLLLILIFAWFKFGFRIKKTVALIMALLVMLLSQLLLIQIVTGNFSSNVVASRFGNLEKEPAGISRLNQLQPLIYNISQKAVLGYGFGKQLTYISQDPRIVKNHPGGVYTTYAFEWGYLDIALKLG
ncbi:MAG: O-antigen ligase family protein, partial [Candidatus Buchananbacteria bacterium]